MSSRAIRTYLFQAYLLHSPFPPKCYCYFYLANFRNNVDFFQKMKKTEKGDFEGFLAIFET